MAENAEGEQEEEVKSRGAFFSLPLSTSLGHAGEVFVGRSLPSRQVFVK